MSLQIGYIGTVTVSKYRHGRLQKRWTRQNNGTWALFNYLCASLLDQNVGSDIPTVLDVTRIASGEIPTESILRAQPQLELVSIDMDTQNISTTKSCSISWRATLTSSYVDGTTLDGDAYYCLRAGSSGNVLAFLPTGSTAARFTIASDEVFTITWTMTIGNTTEAEQALTEQAAKSAASAVQTPTRTRRIKKSVSDTVK